MIEAIRLTAGATARIDVTLNLWPDVGIGKCRRRHSADADAGREISTNVSNELIDQLPLVVGGAMRSVFDLVSIVPEAKGTGANVSLGGGQGRRVRRDAGRHFGEHEPQREYAKTAFLTPSVEAITESSVETNGFKPEFGQAGGGGITFASKSGTNDFHGSLYNFLRNEALDQRILRDKKEHLPAEQLRRLLGRPGAAPKIQRKKQNIFLCGV